jgi:hypothetical protein
LNQSISLAIVEIEFLQTPSTPYAHLFEMGLPTSFERGFAQIILFGGICTHSNLANLSSFE